MDVRCALSPLDQLEETHLGAFLNEEEREEEFDTIGGLVFHVAGRVPGAGKSLPMKAAIHSALPKLIPAVFGG